MQASTFQEGFSECLSLNLNKSKQQKLTVFFKHLAETVKKTNMKQTVFTKMCVASNDNKRKSTFVDKASGLLFGIKLHLFHCSFWT